MSTVVFKLRVISPRSRDAPARNQAHMEYIGLRRGVGCFLFLMSIGHADPTMKIYEILFEKHKATMYYAAMNILQDSQLAGDAIQQAFERMIRYRVGEKIQDPYCNKTRYFLVTIVKNKIVFPYL